MIFPVIYAVFTWGLAIYWRRKWPSFAAVGLSVLLLVMAIRMIDAWKEQLPYQAQTGLVLLYPYTVLVAVVGVFGCLLPRRGAEMDCGKCGYCLSGLEPMGLKCPECGSTWRGRGSEFEDKTELLPIPKLPIELFAAQQRDEDEGEVIVIDWPAVARGSGWIERVP